MIISCASAWLRGRGSSGQRACARGGRQGPAGHLARSEGPLHDLLASQSMRDPCHYHRQRLRCGHGLRRSPCRRRTQLAWCPFRRAYEALPRPSAPEPRRPYPASGALEERTESRPKVLPSMGHHGKLGGGQGRSAQRLTCEAPPRPRAAHAQRRATAGGRPPWHSTGHLKVHTACMAHGTP